MHKRNWLLVLFWFTLILLETRPAYAYLDPGTGSALVCVLVSVVAAFTYVARSVVYAVKHRLRQPGGAMVTVDNASDDQGDIVLFSEGRDYWLTFKPVIKALLARNCRFRYLTMDVEDPALEIDDPRMDSRYIGNGYVAFGRVAAARGSVMLSTTPNIGVADFPIPKPSNVDCLVHCMHGCCDVTYYHRHSLDNYDAVFIINPAMERSIRHLEAVRGLTPKECIVAGTPNLDEIYKTVQKREQENTKPVILLAPTWGLKGFLRRYGSGFIETLAATGEYELILRPHPQSWRKEPRFMAELVDRLKKYFCVTVDKSLSPAETLSRADLLVSDISGIRFEFAFLYYRPVITLKAEGEDDSLFEAADMDSSWEQEAETRIGAVVGPDEIEAMPAIVKKTLAISTEKMAAYSSEYVAHLGHSGEVVADWLIAKKNAVKVDL